MKRIRRKIRRKVHRVRPLSLAQRQAARRHVLLTHPERLRELLAPTVPTPDERGILTYPHGRTIMDYIPLDMRTYMIEARQYSPRCQIEWASETTIGKNYKITGWAPSSNPHRSFRYFTCDCADYVQRERYYRDDDSLCKHLRKFFHSAQHDLMCGVIG